MHNYSYNRICCLFIILLHLIQNIHGNGKLHLLFIRHIESINNANGDKFNRDSPVSHDGKQHLQNLFDGVGDAIFNSDNAALYKAAIESNNFQIEGMI